MHVVCRYTTSTGTALLHLLASSYSSRISHSWLLNTGDKTLCFLARVAYTALIRNNASFGSLGWALARSRLIYAVNPDLKNNRIRHKKKSKTTNDSQKSELQTRLAKEESKQEVCLTPSWELALRSINAAVSMQSFEDSKQCLYSTSTYERAKIIQFSRVWVWVWASMSMTYYAATQDIPHSV